MLRRGRIWALNVGENFKLSSEAWIEFTNNLPLTNVTHMYVSEPHFGGITSHIKVTHAPEHNAPTCSVLPPSSTLYDLHPVGTLQAQHAREHTRQPIASSSL